MTMEPSDLSALAALNEAEKLRRKNISECISEVEMSINATLLVVGSHHPGLRKALLEARGSIREAIGEART
jgi:hypothetical protein